ncbi:MAG: hypothetical protein KBE04_10395 [Phycisphaerae bacterium]|nr:hypothetical protein [Phycisphaerae bacterium]
MKTRSIMLAWFGLFAVCVRPAKPSDPVGVFEYPCMRVALSDPDNDCWTGMDLNGTYPVPVDPDACLVGPPPSGQSGVTLPTDHWIELGFCGPIGDGPGPDLILTEQGRMGERALILLGDGAHDPYPVGVAAAESTGGQPTTVIQMDLASVRVPFVPTTVRILSLGLGGGSPGFDVGSVRARIVAPQGPVAAYPNPGNLAREVCPRTILTWRPGLGADRHTVYFGKQAADANEGALPVTEPPQPQEGTSFDPGFLELGRQYFWRVDEVAEHGDPQVRKGDLWTFQVADRMGIDDLESSGAAWVLHEGWFARTELAGQWSEVPPYEGCSSLIVHFGVYANECTGVARGFDPPQDWAATGADTLELAVHGLADNPAQTYLYLGLSDGLQTCTVRCEDPHAVTDPQWRVWRIPLEAFAGLDRSRIEQIVVGLAFEPNDPSWGVWGQIGLDSIVLYRDGNEVQPPFRTDLNADGRVDCGDLVQMADHWLEGGPIQVPVQEPNSPVAWYRFDGNAEDSMGSAHGRLEGSPEFVDGRIGLAMLVSGTQDVELPPDHVRVTRAGDLFDPAHKGVTIAFWQRGEDSLHWTDSLVCSDFEYGTTDPVLHIGLGQWDVPGRYQWHFGRPWTVENSLCGAHHDRSEWAGRWNHWCFTADLRSGHMAIFLNGSVYAQQAGPPQDAIPIESLTIGTGWIGHYDGLIDEFRIYDYALGQAEAAFLATDGSGLVDPPPDLREDLNQDGRVNAQDLAVLAQAWLYSSAR